MKNLSANKVREGINNKRMVYGIYVQIPSPAIIEIAGYAGLDFVRIDTHHAVQNLETIENMVRAAELSGVTPFARVHNDPQRILNVLDCGVMGLIIPDVVTKEDAEKAVEYTKYYPFGTRGLVNTNRASKYGEVTPTEYLKWAEKEIMLGLQIESIQGIENLDSILSVKGIDLILGGRQDIAQSMGLPGQSNHPSVIEGGNGDL